MGPSPESFLPPEPVIVARPVRPPKPPRLELPSLSRRDAALDLVLIAVTGLVVPFGSQMMSMLFMDVSSMMELMPPPVIGVITKWLDALLAAGLLFYLVKRHQLPLSGFGLRFDGLGMQCLWGGAALIGSYAVMFVSMIFIGLLVVLIPEWQEDFEGRMEFLDMILQFKFWEMTIMLVAVVIHEEVLFRGLLIPYLRRAGCNWVWAIGISTAIFASLHAVQGVLGIVQIFGVGLVLAIIFVVSRSLIAVMIAHFLFDLFQTQIARLIPYAQELAEQAEQTGM